MQTTTALPKQKRGYKFWKANKIEHKGELSSNEWTHDLLSSNLLRRYQPKCKVSKAVTLANNSTGWQIWWIVLVKYCLIHNESLLQLEEYSQFVLNAKNQVRDSGLGTT